jgi:hypothetical protein
MTAFGPHFHQRPRNQATILFEIRLAVKFHFNVNP